MEANKHYKYMFIDGTFSLYTPLVDRERGKDDPQTSDMRYVNNTIIRTFDIVITLAIMNT